jgi:hypothetical protein
MGVCHKDAIFILWCLLIVKQYDLVSTLGRCSFTAFCCIVGLRNILEPSLVLDHSFSSNCDLL